jgi:predicted RNase H-like nuclease (RuvC/YqgF family)
MQVDLTAVLGVAGSVISLVASVYIAILRYALAAKEQAFERRFTEIEKDAAAQTTSCASDLKKQGDRLAEVEKAAVRVEGRLDLVQNNHDALTRDLEEIKRNMITKAEFEPRMTNLERTLNQILAELRGRYPSHGTMPAVVPPPGTKR